MDDEKLNVLIVDDNEEFAKVMRIYLERRGMRVFEAHNAQEALKILEEHKNRIHVALLDLILPDMSGAEVLRIMREIAPDMGIIVITGVKDIRTAVELMKAGADEYITKPFRLGDLEDKINEVLYTKAMKSHTGEALTAERAEEIIDSIPCEEKGRMLRFEFRDIQEMNRFIESVRKKKGWRIKDIHIGEEMEVFVSKSEEK